MPRNVDHDERRKEIATVMLDIIARDGVGAVTFRSVADASGWSTGVLMHYFKNRQGMLLEALRAACRESSLTQKKSMHDLRGIEALIAILEDPLPRDNQRLALGRIFTFFYAEAMANAEIANEVEGYLRRWRRAAEHAIVAAQAVGELDPQLDPIEFAYFAVAYADGLSLHALLNKDMHQIATTASPVRDWLDPYRT